jgi:hypothetical protein
VQSFCLEISLAGCERAEEPVVKRAIHLCGLFFLGAALGLPSGIYLVQHKVIDKEKAWGMLGEEALTDEFAKKQFQYADPQNAREALLYALDIHKEMRATNPIWGWPQKWDLGWCYGELSLLERSTGNADVAEDYMAQAEQIFKELGRMDYFKAHIRWELQKGRFARYPLSDKHP